MFSCQGVKTSLAIFFLSGAMGGDVFDALIG
jgi:hypothetical protein